MKLPLRKCFLTNDSETKQKQNESQVSKLELDLGQDC